MILPNKKTFMSIKTFILHNWIFYFVGSAIIISIKLYCRIADSNDLAWILTPTAWWVRTLSGIPFENEPQTGYINHYFRFIIAPSCCGLQFMTVAIATLIYSFVHRMRSIRRGFYWITGSLIIAYFFTIFINGFRIVLSIYLPLFLYKTGIHSGWMTPERLHTTIGTIVYFSSLLLIYCIAGHISLKIAAIPAKKTDVIRAAFSDRLSTESRSKYISPVFWYFFIVLGIPILNQSYKNDGKKFAEYAAILTAVSLSILFLSRFLFIIRKHLRKHK